MKDIKLLHQRVFLPDLFCFVFSTLRGLVLTLPSMPSRWQDTCQRTSSPSSTKCGNLWCRLLSSMPSWLWSPSTPSCWWWRSFFLPLMRHATVPFRHLWGRESSALVQRYLCSSQFDTTDCWNIKKDYRRCFYKRPFNLLLLKAIMKTTVVWHWDILLLATNYWHFTLHYFLVWSKRACILSISFTRLLIIQVIRVISSGLNDYFYHYGAIETNNESW